MVCRSCCTRLVLRWKNKKSEMFTFAREIRSSLCKSQFETAASELQQTKLSTTQSIGWMTCAGHCVHVLGPWTAGEYEGSLSLNKRFSA